ncbi:RSB1 [[Candida] subhashii]|uniref:Sphingoid long-chain base transporter RSB1 n=1 Tax=[Candida] subhashii TaxID=561895 RepID=A0A8J5UKW1_9ASCO|nr:RSB1 [[Candida] subhashii]KAG7662371.1 RSB1 [[Candida] subhashii]
MDYVTAIPMSTWEPSTLPTTTSISTIDPTNLAGIYATLLIASRRVKTETNSISLYFLSRDVRGAAASYTLIKNQEYLATATATQDFPLITEEMFNATLNLKALEWDANLYKIDLSVVANVLFAALFGICFICHFGLAWRARTKYFGACMIVGTGLEFAGYLARTFAHYAWSDPNLFLCQIICLTMAPAFVMAGIYYLLGQLLVSSGRQYSVLKPIWFSYVFIFCDVASLLIQGSGGTTAAVELHHFGNTKPGTFVMVAGVAFQVVSMTIFLGFLFDFIHRVYFKPDPDITFSIKRLFQLLFNTPEGIKMKRHLDRYYTPEFENIRNRRCFQYAPSIILLSVLLIYIRCIYRVIELSQGWRGYLITHEEYIMALDALPVFLACAIYVPFHPLFLFGRETTRALSFGSIRVASEVKVVDDHESKYSEDSTMLNFVFVTKLKPLKPSSAVSAITVIDDSNRSRSQSAKSVNTTWNSPTNPFNMRISEDNELEFYNNNHVRK